MAIQTINSTPRVKMFSEPKPLARAPHLYIVGLWSAFSTMVGDATAGAANMQFYPYPAAPILPLLPKLEGWFSILGLGLDNNSSGMQMTVTGRSNFVLSGYDYMNFKIAGAAVGNADGTYCWTANDDYKQWILKYNPNTGYRGVRVDWISNDNAKTYNGAIHGLLLKDQDQLVAEGLWKGKK